MTEPQPQPNQLPLIVMISWPDDPDRGVEAYGPFTSETRRSIWIRECQQAADRGYALLQGAEYRLTRLDTPFAIHLVSDGYPVTVGARFWSNDLRVVEVTKVADHSNAYSDTGEIQTWHDTTVGSADTLSGTLREYGRLTRFYPHQPARNSEDAADHPVGTSYSDLHPPRG